MTSAKRVEAKCAEASDFGNRDDASRRKEVYRVAHGLQPVLCRTAPLWPPYLAISYLRSGAAKRWLRMSNPSKTASGFNRRQFLQGAVLTGAAALTAERLSAQGRAESSPASGSSLVRPAALASPGDPPLAPPDKRVRPCLTFQLASSRSDGRL